MKEIDCNPIGPLCHDIHKSLPFLNLTHLTEERIKYLPLTSLTQEEIESKNLFIRILSQIRLKLLKNHVFRMLVNR